MITVTKPFLPPIEEYEEKIKQIWGNVWLTNDGPYVRELEQKLVEKLGVPALHFVGNGTLALQLAIKALDLKGEIITTPFSFVATTTAIMWENCIPVYVDICKDSLCIDANKIEEAITENTVAILATHVYGIPCDVERIEEIAKKHNLKVIYDAAHAFGVKYKGKSILSYGDISTLSFHATKLFHTIEGGGIINNIGLEVNKKIQLLRKFGFEGEDYIHPGINARNTEFHAAMGICNLKYVDKIIEKRKEIYNQYNLLLTSKIRMNFKLSEVEYNYSYFPVLFKNEDILIKVVNVLKNNKIEVRRYFYPSLNKLPYLDKKIDCPNAEDISKKILCLPVYNELSEHDIKHIAELINFTIEKE
ncbi:DegT/DnrJ/EryC1/StrS family aminotransferase [Lysinibacillus piscis]|uniref:Aminotransferase DegT n=1 Tax=Lysinibacillus piscis TaxID=2518931 RepID=A0ABQ5NHP4_9BACI|nr:DegT/DnrJ/EryC1/StrS family aminotransferase [Lysinibacillus sp. KH24]GLC87818.1 aminotransferase DegT [Lysinibacillus sp. KH24]